MLKINERLIEIRKLSGLDREAAADLLGLKYANYTHYETGRNKIPLEQAVDWCKKMEDKNGNQFIYLSTGLKVEEYLSTGAAKLAMDADQKRDTINAFNEVIRRALRRGHITAKNDQCIDDIANDFADLIGEGMSKITNFKSIKTG
jgi:transcriptional regulator with XRE-family HTH domain